MQSPKTCAPETCTASAIERAGLPKPGELDDDPLRVPRLWFDTHPHLVPTPFSWHSERGAGVTKHPYRTMHVLLAIDDFIKLTNSPQWQLKYKAEHMEANYLPAAEAMVRGELAPDFPIPWLEIRQKSDGTPKVWGHEGRHRALMAKRLGLKVLPVILVLRKGPEGWEHYSETIDSDPIVEQLTRGSRVWIYSQDYGRSHNPPQYMYLTPRTPNGNELAHELIRLRMTIDPKYRNRN